MKVAFFTPHIHWPSHYETELELIQKHLDNGDEVIQLVCNAELPSCDINPEHSLQKCFSCMGCRDFGTTLIDGNFIQKSFLMLKPKDKEEISALKTDYANIKELQKLKIDNFDLGYAVASSLISLTRNPEPDLAKLKVNLKNYLISSLGIYKSLINFLSENSIDKVYTFNGRFAHVKPVLRACQKMQVECYIHERGNSKDYYALFKNTTPHDIAYISDQIKKLWEAADPEQRDIKGREFFTNRSRGIEKSWFSFTKDQVRGLLPDNWNKERNNIVIFNSSEDEFASVGEEWNNPLYKNQLEGLKRIIADMENDSNIHLYLRIHPNLKNVVNQEKELLYLLKGKNLTLIHAESPVSTYDLIKAADKVISFGSTVGIEAVYWGTPSVLAGKAFYYNVGGTYIPSSHENLLDLLRGSLDPKSIEPALMYGFYMNTYGIPFKYYQAESLAEGKFKGKYVLSKEHVKLKPINWLLWKPFVRNFRLNIDNLHRNKLIILNY